MNIAVTGAAGFVGSHLCERLAVEGHTVVGIDSFTDYYPVAIKRRNAAEVADKGVRIHELDLVSDRLDEVLRDCQAIFHLAAQPGISDTTPFDDYLRNNLVATERLLQAGCRLRELRMLVNVSTSSVYGYYATSAETEPPTPASYYGVTKLAGEQLALAYHREGRLPVCSLRLFSVYGPRERPEKLYTKLIAAIAADAEFPLHEGSERHSRSYTYVGDAVAGLVAALMKPDAAAGEIFNIGSDVEITTARGIEIIESTMGRSARKVLRPPRSGDQLRTCANIEKARRVLGYDPQVKPEDGLRRQVDWYLENARLQQ